METSINEFLFDKYVLYKCIKKGDLVRFNMFIKKFEDRSMHDYIRRFFECKDFQKFNVKKEAYKLHDGQKYEMCVQYIETGELVKNDWKNGILYSPVSLLWHAFGGNVTKDKIEIIKVMIKYGEDVDLVECRYKYDRTPLAKLCEFPNNNAFEEACRLLLDHGADPFNNKYGAVPFHVLCKNSTSGSIKAIKMFLKRPHDRDVYYTSNGKNIAQVCMKLRNMNKYMYEFFEKNGIPIFPETDPISFINELHMILYRYTNYFSFEHRMCKFLKILLRHKPKNVSIDMVNSECLIPLYVTSYIRHQTTPLQFASYLHLSKACRLLINKQNANPYIYDCHGNNSFHLIFKSYIGDVDSYKKMIHFYVSENEYEYDLATRKNFLGETPLDLCLKLREKPKFQENMKGKGYKRYEEVYNFFMQELLHARLLNLFLFCFV